MMYGTEKIIQFALARSDAKVFVVISATYNGDLGDSNWGCTSVELFGEASFIFSTPD